MTRFYILRFTEPHKLAISMYRPKNMRVKQLTSNIYKAQLRKDILTQNNIQACRTKLFKGSAIVDRAKKKLRRLAEESPLFHLI